MHTTMEDEKRLNRSKMFDSIGKRNQGMKKHRTTCNKWKEKQKKPGEDRSPATRTVRLFPVNQFSDAVGVEDVSAPAKLADHIMSIVIFGTDEAHPVDRSSPEVQQIFEPNDRKINQTFIIFSGVLEQMGD
ncbi:hypothetical protein E3N88_07601 [Mikania micrantha]|uniref:Uncharacterized protein n=1 Tax=Mikania micrantha TaxID=192012 RepID=A0A5N6PU14_9ASTR|nr:hypothetical protein E3N88_07601 [Mikania micrantha]